MAAFEFFVSSVDFFGPSFGDIFEFGTHVRDSVGMVFLDQGLVE